MMGMIGSAFPGAWPKGPGVRNASLRTENLMNLLLVEDDASIVSALTDLLHSEGFSVQACATQDAACEALDRYARPSISHCSM